MIMGICKLPRWWSEQVGGKERKNVFSFFSPNERERRHLPADAVEPSIERARACIDQKIALPANSDWSHLIFIHFEVM